jgi:hypothetical protein
MKENKENDREREIDRRWAFVTFLVPSTNAHTHFYTHTYTPPPPRGWRSEEERKRKRKMRVYRSLQRPIPESF